MSCEKCGLNPQPYRITVTKDPQDKVWLVCDTCLPLLKPSPQRFGESSMITTDDIPGGYEVKHGLVNSDGSPRKFYSKSEIKKAAFESGWSISGDTPKPNQRIVESRKAEAERKERRLRD